MLLRLTPYAGEVEAEAWGPGAAWVLDGVPELLGEADSWDGFEPLPEHGALVDAARRFPHVRVPRTRAVFEAMAAAGIEQVVTGKEAFRAWRLLLREYGEPAPGLSTPDGRVMMVPPSPEEWRQIPSWQWLRAGVEGRRSRVVVTAATRAKALERTLELADSRRSSGDCGRCRASGCGPRPRCGSGRTVTPTLSRSRTTTCPATCRTR